MKSVTGDINVPGYYKKDVFQTSPWQASQADKLKEFSEATLCEINNFK